MTSWEIREGDCLDVITGQGLAFLESKSADAIITDPPYEAEAHGPQRRRLVGKAARIANSSMEFVASTPLGFSSITEEQREAFGAECGRLARRWVLVFCQVEAAMLWRAALCKGGLEYVRTMVWTKPDAQPQYTGDRPGVGYESVVVCHPKGRKRWNGGGRVGVFSHTRERGPGGMGAPHPTTKPLPLMRELVSLFSDEGELVLDPFAGSGSTGVVCRELGRRFLGWELDPVYAEIARRRIAGDEAKPTQAQPSLF